VLPPLLLLLLLLQGERLQALRDQADSGTIEQPELLNQLERLEAEYEAKKGGDAAVWQK
jgi:hypothetical protein